MILSFTTSSFAYAKTKQASLQLLQKQLKQNYTTAKFYYVADVSHISDDTQIIHDIEDGQMVCRTSDGVAIAFEKLTF